VRLIEYGDLPAEKLTGSSYWKIPLSSILAFEEQRAEHQRMTAQWSRDLDAMGAPAERARRCGWGLGGSSELDDLRV